MSRQTFIPGTEPPDRNEKIEIAIERWYEGKQVQRDAADVTAVRLASLIEIAAEEGVEVYPFLDPVTGKRRILDVSAQRKARVRKAPSAKQEAADREFDRGAVGVVQAAVEADAISISVNGGPSVSLESAAERLLKPGQKRGRHNKRIEDDGHV